MKEKGRGMNKLCSDLRYRHGIRLQTIKTSIKPVRTAGLRAEIGTRYHIEHNTVSAHLRAPFGYMDMYQSGTCDSTCEGSKLH